MIYFIQSKQYVKIGFSDNPESRLKELQTGSPVKLKLLGTMPGCFQTESELHKIFSHKRTNGEWFRYDGFLKSCIIALNDPHNLYEVTDVRSLQKAGTHLQLMQKSNRLDKDHKFNKRINSIKILGGVSSIR
jgi:hypothetical protein